MKVICTPLNSLQMCNNILLKTFWIFLSPSFLVSSFPSPFSTVRCSKGPRGHWVAKVT